MEVSEDTELKMRFVEISTNALSLIGRSRDGPYEQVLADSEREAVADLLQYLENVCHPS